MKKQNSPVRFALIFVCLFLAFYYFNIFFFAVTNPGEHYNSFLADNLNYIYALRWLLLHSSAAILRIFGFTALVNNYELLVAGRGVIQLVYSCLGLGVMSFFAAFVLAYPKPARQKLIFLLTGIIVIQLLNITRFVLLVLFWHKSSKAIIDHHTIFNTLIYVIISISLYFWVKTDITVTKQHAKN